MTPSVDPATGGLTTPLFDMHAELGARMANFGGHALPMRFEGTVAEHRATRTAAGLFDVSHMGIIELHPAGGADNGQNIAAVAAWLERVVVGSIVDLAPGRMRYTLFTTADGGVLDDLIVTNLGDRLRLVVNAVRTEADLEMLRGANYTGPQRDGPSAVEIAARDDLALMALQGPEAVRVLAESAPSAADLAFMQSAMMPIGGIECEVSRCGYTGEDGFEIAAAAEHATRIARLLLGSGNVTPAGLGARDTLRLEAGLPLVGQELTEATTPAEAGLGWAIPKRRRTDGGFPGAELIAAQLRDGAARKRVGITADGRRPIRDGATLTTPAGSEVGMITSGGFGPTVDAPVAMAYVGAQHSQPGTKLEAQGRKGPEPCRVAELPFVAHRFAR